MIDGTHIAIGMTMWVMMMMVRALNWMGMGDLNGLRRPIRCYRHDEYGAQ